MPTGLQRWHGWSHYLSDLYGTLPIVVNILVESSLARISFLVLLALDVYLYSVISIFCILQFIYVHFCVEHGDVCDYCEVFVGTCWHSRVVWDFGTLMGVYSSTDCPSIVGVRIVLCQRVCQDFRAGSLIYGYLLLFCMVDKIAVFNIYVFSPFFMIDFCHMNGSSVVDA